MSVAVLLFCLATYPVAATALRIEGTAMGTTYSIEIPVLPHTLTAQSVRDGVDGVLTVIERQMSTYRPDSEISRFNASTSTTWFPVSGDTQRVVAEASAVAELSGGAFDVTVGPLVDLWGFGVNRGVRRPSSEAIKATQTRIGFQRIAARTTPAALRKENATLAIDLSALAKGFGVDRVADYLAGTGVEDYLVEIGGELRGHGRNARGTEWTVAIEQPDLGDTRAATVLRLGDAAVATSGNYRSYFDENGERYSHIIDPRSGLPIRHDLVSVSVVASTTVRADALATALLVLGADDGQRLAMREGIAALFIVRDGSTFRTTRTTSFEQLERR